MKREFDPSSVLGKHRTQSMYDREDFIFEYKGDENEECLGCLDPSCTRPLSHRRFDDYYNFDPETGEEYF